MADQENPQDRSASHFSNSSSRDDRIWTGWRLMLLVRLMVILPQSAICIKTVVQEWGDTCDLRLFTFLVVYSVILASEILFSICLLICLPLGGRWTWSNQKRHSLSVKCVLADSITLIGHVCVTISGLFFIKQVDAACLEFESSIYSVSFYMILVDIIGLGCIAFPALTIPCSFSWAMCIPKPRGLTYAAYKSLAFIKFKPSQQEYHVSFSKRNQTPCQVKSMVLCEDCAICMEAWVKGDTLCILPCYHYFHKKCLRNWLNDHKDCPNCRAEITC